MSLTLLLDLDDTLLNNDINTFLPGYLKALGQHLSHRIPPERLARQLLASTEKMLHNGRPLKTLEEAFDEDFYPALGVTKEQMRADLLDFYTNAFPTLSYLTSPRPEALKLVEYAFQKGWQVVIATNPLFPQAAIFHRLAWAQLPVSTFPFALVTSYEHFHFAKPNPAFYAEILARLGWPSGPTVMVGNSIADDLIPAGRLGFPGFWLTAAPAPLPESLPPLSRQGRLEEVIPWLDEVEASNQPAELAAPDGLLAVLQSTPAALDIFGRGASIERWNLIPKAGEWCFTEIICHLRDADREINLTRVDKITKEENAFIPAINADAWSTERSYCSEDGRAALAGFGQSRLALIERLRSLTPAEWLRPARHAIFGPSNLQELISFTVTHDRTHIQQALQTLRLVAES